MTDELDRSVDDIQIGEVEGWRICSYNGSRLKAYANDYEWAPGENEAICTAIGSYTEKVYKNKPDGSGVELVEQVNHTAIPDPDCMCGFWMYKTPEGLKTKGPGMGRGGGYSLYAFGGYGGFGRSANNGFGGFAPAIRTGMVVVQTKGWGRVVEGADGYRCEKAAITAIVDTGDDFLQELADYYNVPLVQPPEGMDNDPDVVEGTVTDVSPKVMGRSGKARPSTVTITTEVPSTSKVAPPSDNSDETTSNKQHLLKVWPDNATYRSLSLWLGKRVKVYTRQQHSRYGSDRFIHRAYLQDSPSPSESQD